MIKILNELGPYGVTAEYVRAELDRTEDSPVEVEINSPGGCLFESIAVYLMLRADPRPVHVAVRGIAASGAALVALAGDRLTYGSASFFMLHRTASLVIGNTHDLRIEADALSWFDTGMFGTIASRIGCGVEEIANLVDQSPAGELWLRGDEIMELVNGDLFRKGAAGIAGPDEAERPEAESPVIAVPDEIKATEEAAVQDDRGSAEAARIESILLFARVDRNVIDAVTSGIEANEFARTYIPGKALPRIRPTGVTEQASADFAERVAAAYRKKKKEAI